MPTLEELFKTKPIGPSGATAQTTYAIQNSKKIRISSSNGLINVSGMLLARGARSLFGITTSESLLEAEVTGLRVIRAGSVPFIYGTDLPRITLRTTDALSRMKEATSGQLVDTGAIGAKVTNLVNTVKSKLGLPTLATPTYVTSELNNPIKYDIEQVSNRMIQLSAIREDAAGSILGKFLKGLGGGDLKTVGRQALGSAIKLGKGAIRKKLFGSDERAGTLSSKSAIVLNPINGTTPFTKQSVDKFFGAYGIGYGALTTVTNPQTSINPLTPENRALNKFNSTYTNINNINPSADEADNRKDLSQKQQLDYLPVNEWRAQGGDIAPISFTQTPDRLPKFTDPARLLELQITNFRENSNRGFGTTSDSINQTGKYKGTKKIGNNSIDDVDFVTLKFKSLVTNENVNFRATITGLTETFSPSWDSAKFIGSPFNFYTYSGIDRSVSFNFKAYSLNAKEHKIIWNNLNFLSTLTTPGFNNLAVIPPFIEITIGDLYKNKAGFIESLTYTFDDTYPWQINTPSKKEKYISSQPGQELRSEDEDMKGYVLPMIVDVNITVKFIESRSTMSAKKLYNFEPVVTN